MSEYINDPKLVDEVFLLRAENSSLYREIQFLKETNQFLRDIITCFISK